MRLLADACIDLRVAESLRHAQGHDVSHLRDERQQNLPDSAVIDKAIAEDRILVTHDLDFGEIAAHSRGRAVRVVLIRLRDTRARHVIGRLVTVLRSCQRALQRPAVVVVEESRHRIRRLPIGRADDPE